MAGKKGFFEKVEAEVVNQAKGYVKEKITNKIIKYGEISILVLLSFILISIGISSILANTFPILSGGYSYILLGVVFLLISLALKI